MARLNDLLAYARRSDRRRVSTTRSGSFQTFTMLVGAGTALGFVRQLKRIMFGPVALRLQSAEYLILALAALWLLGPLSVRPSIPTTSLQVYPITDSQRLFYRVLSHGQNIQTVMMLIGSLLGILALIRVPESPLRMAQAATCLIAAASAGVALRSGFMKLTTIQSNFRRTREQRSLQFLAHPLYRKEISYFARTLDPYVGLIMSFGFSYSELLASWLTPAKAAVLLLLVAAVQLPAIVNPFALDNAVEKDRYRLMPLPAWKISVHKHVALTTILLFTMSPLIVAALVRMTLKQDLATLVELSIILVSWLCSGVILIRLDESRNIRMSFGSLSGTGFSFGLFGLAVLILVPAPLASALLLRSGTSPLAVILSAGLLCVLGGVYGVGLHPSSRTAACLD
jgi:hypothetical protein